MIITPPQPAYVTDFHQTFPSFALNCGFYPAVLDKLMAQAYGWPSSHYVPLIGFEKTLNQAELPLLLRDPNSETSREMFEDWNELQRIVGYPRQALPTDEEERVKALGAILNSAEKYLKPGRRGRTALFYDELRTISYEDALELSEALTHTTVQAWFDLMETETNNTAYAFFLARAMAPVLMIGSSLTEKVLVNSIAYFLRQDDEIEAARASVYKALNKFEMTNVDWISIIDDLRTASAYSRGKDDELADSADRFAAMASREADAIVMTPRATVISSQPPRSDETVRERPSSRNPKPGPAND